MNGLTIDEIHYLLTHDPDEESEEIENGFYESEDFENWMNEQANKNLFDDENN